MVKRIIRIVVVLIISLVASIFFYANSLILAYGNTAVNAVADAPTRAVALVFGGGMKAVGVESDRQEDRVKRGIELYKAGKAKKIMMTGDDGGMNADEVSVMRKFALDHGIPDRDILVDPHGYRTYESCWRAHYVYHLDSVLAVSQSFHISRIMYLCNSLGVPTFGVTADLRPQYDNVWYMEAREALARVKAYLDITILKPVPRVTT